jgi:putative ABC transport system permease protein
VGVTHALNQRVELWGQSFEVIGTLEPVPSELGMGVPGRNLLMVIPLTTFLELRGQRSLSLTGELIDPNRLAEGVTLARAILRSIRMVPPTQEDDFVITDNREVNDVLDGMTALLTAAVGFITVLLFVSSGIGIANVLLASVHQRRGEIGVRMALGATPSMIRSQFLLESTLWALVGGGVGCVLASAALALGRWKTDYEFSATPSHYALCLLACGCVGILAGIIPAARAARQMPAQVIRAS